MKIVQDNLWLCQDCLFAAVNGDFSGLDYHYGPTESAKRQGEIERGLARLGPDLVSDFNSESGDGVNEFSSRSCDSCHDWHAGSRHRFAILGPEVNS